MGSLSLPPRGDARIREREAQRAAEAAEKASEGEEDLDFEEFGFDGLGCNWDHGIAVVVLLVAVVIVVFLVFVLVLGDP